MIYFEVKVNYTKNAENGQKKATETYLVDAMSFTEAEERATEELKAFHLADFTVAAVKKTNYSDMYLNYIEGRYYRAKVSFIAVDEKTGKEKYTNVCYLIEAKDLPNAVTNVQRMIKDSVHDTEITAMMKTDIVDVIMEK